ncbi:ABC transporter substrate-binding protein [Desulfurivibrio dismutans]|uniref:ABC transporter substrate-binding protein n=1 Tax=Desulfurivibrio dismutans TaxID=1398908 RepID=UPI0023DBF088|nr:helical backbone metal receptor [Desulfurivibrio alkaliphilus]MDF1613365.1 helical backbone metal receptor [Desulfurivibrio alkaliphilus]
MDNVDRHRQSWPTLAIPWLLTLALILLLPPMAASAAEQRQIVTDPTGREVTIPATPERVISLAPGITEMIFALKRDELLMGTTQFSNYPPAAKKIPRVGSYVLPDLERIVSLRPDLVLATRDGNPRQLIQRLENLDIPVFAIDPRNLAEIKVSLLALGSVLNAEDQATALAVDMTRRLDRLGEITRHIKHRPLVFFQVDAAPMVSIGEETFLHELIGLAGGRNAAAGGTLYPRFGWEEILTLQPEVVIITSMAGGQSPEKLLQMWRRWPQLEAVRHNRIHVVDADLFDRPTHRLLDGLEILARLIQPQLFSSELDNFKEIE